jgi:hypothetical protein
MSDAGGGEDEAAKFTTLAFKGGRFERPGVPAAAALEFANLDRAVRAVARIVRRGQHRRISADFGEDLDLRMVQFRYSSVIAEVERDRTATLFPVTDEFDAAFELIVAAHRWAGDPVGGTAPTELTPAVLARAALLGANLRESERIELPSSDGSITVCTHRSSLHLREAARPSSAAMTTVLIGRLDGDIYEPTWRARVKPLVGRAVTVNLDEPLDLDVIESVHQGNRMVIIRGDGLFLDDKLTEVDHVAEVYSARPRMGDLKKRTARAFERNLEAIRQRKADWNDGQGLPVHAEGLDTSVALLRAAHARYRTPFPLMGSTEDGGTTMEWVSSLGRVGAELEVDAETIELYSVDVAGGPPEFASVRLSSASAAGDIAAFVGFERAEHFGDD